MRQLNYDLTIANKTIDLIGVGPQPQVPGFTHTNAGYQTVLVQGNYAYVAGTGGNSAGVIGLTLTVFDISDPTNPHYVSYITTGTVPWVSGTSYLNGSYKMAIDGSYLYVASSGSSYFYIVNVSNPTNPFNVSRFFVPGAGSLYGLAIQGNYAYIATQNLGLTVLNISNPLVITETFQEGGTLNKSVGVYVYGQYAYTTNYQTTAPWTVRYFKTWSISNPALPVLLNTYTLPAGTKPSEVMIAGNYAYVADLNTSSIQILDITNPVSPVYLASMFASASFNVANMINIDGNFGYLTSGSNATYGGAIDLFDLSNPSAPIKVLTVKEGIPASLFGVSTLYNNLIYVPDYGTAPSYAASLKIYSTPRTFTSAISSQNLFETSVQVSSSIGTAAGQFTLQASDSLQPSALNPNVPQEWNDLAPYNFAAPTPSLLPKIALCYQQVRVSYINTGSGSIDVKLKALGDIC